MVSKSSGSGNDGKMGVGDKIRMQLIIQLPSLPNNKVDFDVEVGFLYTCFFCFGICLWDGVSSVIKDMTLLQI